MTYTEKEIEQLNELPIQQLTKEHLEIEAVYHEAYGRHQGYEDYKHLLTHAPLHFLEKNIYYEVKYNGLDIEDLPYDFLYNAEIAAIYVKSNVHHMKLLPPSYRDNEDFIHQIALYNGQVLQYASLEIRSLDYVALTALTNSSSVFQYFPDILKTRENCLRALSLPWNSIPAGFNWQHIPLEFTSDHTFIYEAGTICPHIYEYLDSSLKEIKEITYFFVNKLASNLKYAPSHYRNSSDLIAPLVEKIPEHIQYVGQDLKNNPDFILPLITKRPHLIHECGEKIKSNKNIATFICNIRSSHPPVAFFDESVKSDKDIALISVLRMPESMGHISTTLRSNPQFISSYIQHSEFNIIALHYISDDLKNNKDLMIEAYEKDYNTLQYVGEQLKHDPTFTEYIFADFPFNVLLMNLKSLDLKKGDEFILLQFCEQLIQKNMDIYDPQIQINILRQITNHQFSSLLKTNSDFYSYLKSYCLHCSLQDNLSTDNQVKHKAKI